MRSATTKPTGKKRFEAGRKGTIVIAKATLDTAMGLGCLDFRMNLRARPRVAKSARVLRFRTSLKELTRGTVFMVQSQRRSQGANKSQTLRLAR